jgi:hypothetical protein
MTIDDRGKRDVPRDQALLGRSRIEVLECGQNPAGHNRGEPGQPDQRRVADTLDD